MTQEKKKKRWPLHLVLFGCLLLAMLWYLSGLFWNRTGTAMPFYAEEENTIDVLYLGSSKSNAAVAPMQMYERYGFTGYVMYSWSQPVWTAYYYLEDALRSQNPRVVVLEGNDLLYGRRDAEYTDAMNAVNNQNGLLTPHLLTRLRLMLAMRRCQTDHPSLTQGLSIGRYHANWKTLTAQDWLWPWWQPALSTGKGHGPLYLQDPQPQPEARLMPPDDDIYPACMEYLQRCIDLAQKEDFSLVLAIYPDAQLTQEDRSRLAYLSDYCVRQQVPVYDFTLPEVSAAAGLDYALDMGDYSHVNYLGSRKLTAYLADQLTADFTLPDHRGDPAYAVWEDCLQAEQFDAHTMAIRLCPELGGLLELARSSDYITLVCTYGDMTAADASSLRALLRGYGLPETVFDETAAGRVWVWQEGSFTGTERFTLELEHTVSAVPDSILVDGEEAGFGREGISVYVLSAKDGRLLHSITWATEHGYTSYTR